MSDLIWNAIEAGVPKFSGDMQEFVDQTSNYWTCLLAEHYNGDIRGFSNPLETGIELLNQALTQIVNVDNHHDIGQLVRVLTVARFALQHPAKERSFL